MREIPVGRIQPTFPDERRLAAALPGESIGGCSACSEDFNPQAVTVRQQRPFFGKKVVATASFGG
jgi:hypothetical protein